MGFSFLSSKTYQQPLQDTILKPGQTSLIWITSLLHWHLALLFRCISFIKMFTTGSQNSSGSKEIFLNKCSLIKIQTSVFSIRKATTADIPLIRELTFNVWPQTYAALLSKAQIEYMLEMMYSVASLQKQMKEGCRFIIVNDEAEPVGFASYQEIEPAIFKLHKIYVLTSQQRKGTGRFIINYIINEIKQQAAASLQLQVNRNNNAKKFYEKLGFTVLEEADFDIGNGYFMNDYVMEKKL